MTHLRHHWPKIATAQNDRRTIPLVTNPRGKCSTIGPTKNDILDREKLDLIFASDASLLAPAKE
jgi:hypothetical protein